MSALGPISSPRANWHAFGLLVLIAFLSCDLLAQRPGFGGGGRGRGGGGAPAFERGNVPEWSLDETFARDTFTFARLKYRSTVQRTSYSWWTDYPDADLNLSWRLHQVTSLKVHPDGKVVDITDPDLFNYPVVFMSGVPAIILDSEEVAILKRYLSSGGFILVDDFWGERNWEYFQREALDKLFPGQEPEELQLSHPIFNSVFTLREKPQIPNLYFAMNNKDSGVTWEVPDGRTPHYRALYDKKGRLAMLICHNTDLGDGWEEEGSDPYYFAEFSEKKAYPLGINILFYVMTH